MIFNIFETIKWMQVRQDNTRMLIDDLEARYIRLLREVQRLQLQEAEWLKEKQQ